MQAVTISFGLAGGGFPDGAARPALRLGFQPLGKFMPAVTACARIVMGGAVGVAFAGFAGNGAVWIALGVALGVALDSIASRAEVPPPPQAGAPESGPYRVR